MSTFFAYFALVTEILGLIGSIRAMLASKTLTGAALYADIAPALASLQQINSKVAVPVALAQSLCEVVAEAVNKYYGTVGA